MSTSETTHKSLRNAVGLILIIAGAALVACAGIFLFRGRAADRKISEKSEQICVDLETVISVNPDARPDANLPVLAVDGYDCVGYLEVEETDWTRAVGSAGMAEAADGIMPCVTAGDPANGGFIIEGASVDAVFGPLESMEPGDVIRFTQVNGATVTYVVDSSGLMENQDAITPEDLVLISRRRIGGLYVVSATKK